MLGHLTCSGCEACPRGRFSAKRGALWNDDCKSAPTPVPTPKTTATECYKYGKWSECTKKCGTGHQWRNVEEIKCSQASAMKFHMQFRDGRACNTQDCSMKQDDTHQAVKVARVESLHKVVGTSMRR